jgi:hypothetical protein
MEVNTWKGGESFGLRVGRKNAQKYFRKEWTDVDVKIGGIFYTFNLSATFWTTCPEIHGRRIPRWLEERGLHRWEKGAPYVLDLVPIGNKRFELLDSGEAKRTKRVSSIDITLTDD